MVGKLHAHGLLNIRDTSIQGLARFLHHRKYCGGRGQFRAQNIPQNKLGCIAVFKDKTVNLAIGSINEDDIVSFELIYTAERIDLCEPEGITKFSQILMATMMYIKI